MEQQLVGIVRDEDRVGPWLAGSIILALLVLFGMIGLIIYRTYFQTPVVRTALERELVQHLQELRQNPNNANARVGLASVYVRAGQPASAIGQLKQALKIKPDLSTAHYELGMIFIDQGKKAEGIKELKVASRDVNNELPPYQLGMILVHDGRYKQAIQYLQAAVKINPILADAHYYLGLSLEKTGNTIAARGEYQEALKYVPDYPEAKRGLERIGP